MTRFTPTVRAELDEGVVERLVSRGFIIDSRSASSLESSDMSFDPSLISWVFNSSIFLRTVQRLAVLMER